MVLPRLRICAPTPSQVHPYDRFFFDEVSGNYTVERFLADLERRYGGVDAVLLWPTYTNIGIDDRNQFDFFRTMPGGLDGVKQVTAELHAAGVRVLFPYNPWDTGTRREPLDDQRALVALLKQTGGDGANGDANPNPNPDPDPDPDLPWHASHRADGRGSRTWQCAQRLLHPCGCRRSSSPSVSACG